MALSGPRPTGTMNVGGGIYRGKFVGHTDKIQGMVVSKDETFFVSSRCLLSFKIKLKIQFLKTIFITIFYYKNNISNIYFSQK